MSKLALLGGKPIFAKNHKWPKWPISSRSDEKRMLDLVRSGQWGIGSPATERFAKEFAATAKVRHALPVMNGTIALELVVKALGIGPGDEVIVPSYTFIATATCVLQSGATAIFADLDPETLEIDPKHVARLITRRTKAIIPVHFGGNPCDMAALQKLVRGRGIDIIEDAAHAHGMIYRGRPAGSIGVAGCFSFQTSKNMTSGEGGVVTTNNKALYELVKSYHSFGRLPGHEWYEHHYLSSNGRITGLQSALLIGQLERLEGQSQLRLANGRFLDRGLSGIPGQILQKTGDTSPNTRRAYHIYIWRYDARVLGVSRAQFQAALKAEGVDAFGGYPIPLQENPMFVNRRFWHSQLMRKPMPRKDEPDYKSMKTPVAKTLCSEAFWLQQPNLLGTRQDMQGIIDAVAKVATNVGELRARRG